MLYTGFSRQDMTPNKPIPLGGYGNAEQRLGDHVMHPITVSCTAFRDEDGTIALLFSQDTCAVAGAHTDAFKQQLQKKLGVKPENVFFHAIHTHEAPEIRLPKTHPLIKEWYKYRYYPAVLRAAEEAVADLAECEIYAGKDELFGYNYVRRYLDKNGKFVERKNVKNTPGAVHETEPDREVQVLRFARLGRPDIILVNFQSHPSGFLDGYSATNISSDYPHYLRTAVELHETAHCMFIQGAAGNLVFMGLLPGDRVYGKITDKELAMRQYGEGIAQKVLEILKFKTQKLEPGKIRTAEITDAFPVNHSLDKYVGAAQQIVDLYLADKKTEAIELAAKSGLAGDGGSGFYKCKAILNRAGLPKAKEMMSWAMSIGELGFGFAPNEVFDTNGRFVKDNSPFKMTFFCELTNDSRGYLPTELAFSHGGYEVDTCHYSSGVAERMADNILKALEECTKEKKKSAKRAKKA